MTWQGTLDRPDQFKASPVVRSATPFVPPRHWRKGHEFAKFLEEEVRRECEHHRVGAPVALIEESKLPGLFHESEYRRNRKDDPVRPGYALVAV